MSDYYNFTRTEIAPLLPQRATSILDVGCGRAATSTWLRTKYPNAKFTGIEVNSGLADELRGKLDEVHFVDLNRETPPKVEGADLVLLLDVLEHLADPEGVLELLVGNAAADATFIVSLPNVAHISVAAPLFFRARFEYKDAGILDRTHLRFFVRKTVVSLLNSAGLEAKQGLETGLETRRWKWLDALTLGLIRDHFTLQYVVAAHRAPAGGRQGPIDWKIAKKLGAAV